MVYAEKGNRVQQINEADIQRYSDMGYAITDGKGTVLKAVIPDNIAELKVAYKRHTEEIEALKAKVAELEAKLQAKKTRVDKVDDTTDNPEVEDKPKRRSVKADIQ